jgi:hypothetical protein
MTSIKVVVRRLEPDGSLCLVYPRRPALVVTPPLKASQSEDQNTLTERVFLFLDQRSA